MIYKPKVLFVTSREDFAVDYLIYRFLNYDVPYLRLNSEDITNFSIVVDFNCVRIKYKDDVYSLEEVKSVYFRRSPTSFPSTIDINDMSFINQERKDFLEGLYLTLDCKWINPIFSTYKAERKIYQFSKAREVGFKTPKTIISNNPKQLKEFVAENVNCIIKPIRHGLQITPSKAYSIYTSELNELSGLNDDSLLESPILIQDKIFKYRDIRSTVIGNQVFSVEIDTNEVDNTDWRKPELSKYYKLHQLPKHIENKMLRLHEELDLIYSAFDFILTPEGEYYFLETNPAGEWVWLERELNMPISKALIEELIK